MDNNDLTCHQVEVLLSFYVNGKTNYQVTNFIESHLCNCPSCKHKYEMMAKILDDLMQAKAQIDEKLSSEKVYVPQNNEFFNEKLSAYLDSEMSDDEIIRFKKYAISNPPVRGELEDMYKVKNALNNSFEKTKSDFKEDFSKDIVVNLNFEDSMSLQEPILKIASIFIFLFVFLSVGLVVIH